MYIYIYIYLFHPSWHLVAASQSSSRRSVPARGGPGLKRRKGAEGQRGLGIDAMPHARGPFPEPPALGSRTFVREAHQEFMNSSTPTLYLHRFKKESDIRRHHTLWLPVGGGAGWWSRGSYGRQYLRTCLQVVSTQHACTAVYCCVLHATGTRETFGTCLCYIYIYIYICICICRRRCCCCCCCCCGLSACLLCSFVWLLLFGLSAARDPRPAPTDPM